MMHTNALFIKFKFILFWRIEEYKPNLLLRMLYKLSAIFYQFSKEMNIVTVAKLKHVATILFYIIQIIS
jgi:hypothetical protein